MFKVDHIALNVNNISKSINFYRFLGFTKIKKEWTNENNTLQIVLLEWNDDVILELFWQDTNSWTNNCVVGIKHFSLNVENLEETRQYFIRNNIFNEEQLIVKKGRLGRDYFFIKDPDWIPIEIIEKV